MTDIRLTAQDLSVDDCLHFAGDEQVGGLAIFVGTVRRQSAGRQVLRLEFEAYEPMALAEMQKIATTTLEQFAILRIAIHHRIGILSVGEIPVVIAVGAAHRDAAFEACRYAIDTLKQTVPIWKKEIFEDGAIWVSAHP